MEAVAFPPPPQVVNINYDATKLNDHEYAVKTLEQVSNFLTGQYQT
jgi:hypothetical protein